VQVSSNGLNAGVSLAQLNSFGGLGMFAADEEVPDDQMAQYGEAGEDDPTAGLTPEQIAEVQAQAEAQAQAEMAQ
jgi:hypothetical protein